MKATSIKQIKFNRGQVSDLLSERVDMGLQNACGTVYDNTYINRYGQLEPAPMIKLASNGVAATTTKILMLFNTGTDLVLPIGVDYTSTNINYYGWQTTNSINVKVMFRRFSSGSPYKEFTKTCPREPSRDYTQNGVTYYAWAWGQTYDFQWGGDNGGVCLKINYAFTTTPNPSVNSDIILDWTYVGGTRPRSHSESITSIQGRSVILTKSATPQAADEVFDTNLNYEGQLYQVSDGTIIYKGYVYYRYPDIDTSQGSSARLCVYAPLSKSDNALQTDLTTPIASVALTGDIGTKTYQFGYNVVVFDQNTKPFLFNLVPGTNGWYNPTLTLRENHFNDSFTHIYTRGIDVAAPNDFTPPVTGSYRINNQTAITSSALVTISRNGAGSGFTQSLIGQVILCHANSGAVQVRSVESADSLTAYVLSPLTAESAGQTYIDIPFSEAKSEWIFGYERAFSDTQGYPDSVIYVNQRLVFGGNDRHGGIISASRIGVINDFDPESATESDSFTTAISAKDFCRVVDFVVSNNELRIACTNGEYAIPLAYLTPSGSLNGFDLRSEVGIAKSTPICDCGGLTAYVSNDGDSICGTQFSLLRDRYQPVSLTSQTSGVVQDCKQLVYLINRQNNEGNLLVGLNEDGSMFGLSMDTNAGLVAAFRMTGYDMNVPDTVALKLTKLFSCEYGLWGLMQITQFNDVANYKTYLVRFARNEFFCFPTGLTLPTDIAQFINQEGFMFRGLILTENGWNIKEPQEITDNGDGTSTVTFGETEDDGLVVAGFARQSDWRSVEISVGMATREINKNIIKLGAVVKAQEFWNYEHTATYSLPLDTFKTCFNLVRGQRVLPIQEQFTPDAPVDLYGEDESMVWRRAFDNPSRDKIYGFTSIAPFLIKSITATIQYDEVS